MQDSIPADGSTRRPTRLLGMTPSDFRAGGADTEIQFAVAECSLGSILVAQSPNAASAPFSSATIPMRSRASSRIAFRAPRLSAAMPAFERTVAQVVGFVEQPALGLDLPLDVRGTAFQQRVWQALRDIPAGSTASYAEIAARIGRPPQRARRGPGVRPRIRLRSPIPCHRVVRTDGSALGLPLGRGAQAHAAAARRCGMRSAVAEQETAADVAARVERADWTAVAAALDEAGWATVPGLLNDSECADIAGFYGDDRRFRSHVVMARHGFGRGEYKYFRYPLPEIVSGLRTTLYRRLAPIANRWNELMGIPVTFPPEHEAFIDRCHQAGQRRPTPLLLQYGEGDFNALHQDVYGEHLFPLQAAVLLAEPGEDFTGGEFVLTEQRPRMQSRVEVVPLGRGDAVIWAVRNRPVQGTRGAYRVNMRHGVSRLRSGRRHTLGVIFHDAA